MKNQKEGQIKHLDFLEKNIYKNKIITNNLNRIFIVMIIFIIGFFLVTIRLFDVMVLHFFYNRNKLSLSYTNYTHQKAPEILDRNGAILATYINTFSVYINPREINNIYEVSSKLSNLLKIDFLTIKEKIKSNKHKKFIWIAHHISPNLQKTIKILGIHGIYLINDKRRIYPYKNLTSHVVGYVNLDNKGMSGIEKFLSKNLKSYSSNSIKLSIDVQVQHVVREELIKSINKFSARAANAIVLNLYTGEILSMVSLPDYDPNYPEYNMQATFNRNTFGLYEPGSTYKIYNIAIALETKSANLNSLYDARFPLKINQFTIEDFKGKKKFLTLKEAFLYSSNIVNAKIALNFGASLQKDFLKKFGMFDSPNLEIQEISPPILPRVWRESTVATISYGYGTAVSPLQLIVGVGSIINNGIKIYPTLLKRNKTSKPLKHKDILVSKTTSKEIRKLMRLVVKEGTGKLADVNGYKIIGKTGTAYLSKNGRYSSENKVTTFVGSFNNYGILVMLDSPKPVKESSGYSTAGWNAAPTAGSIISKLIPLL